MDSVARDDRVELLVTDLRRQRVGKVAFHDRALARIRRYQPARSLEHRFRVIDQACPSRGEYGHDRPCKEPVSAAEIEQFSRFAGEMANEPQQHGDLFASQQNRAPSPIATLLFPVSEFNELRLTIVSVIACFERGENLMAKSRNRKGREAIRQFEKELAKPSEIPVVSATPEQSFGVPARPGLPYSPNIAVMNKTAIINSKTFSEEETSKVHTLIRVELPFALHGLAGQLPADEYDVMFLLPERGRRSQAAVPCKEPMSRPMLPWPRSRR
jgi:hypothetical protein